MSADAETFRKIAKLIRLELTEEEIETFGGQIGTVLEYIQTLSTVNVEGQEALGSFDGLVGPRREDQPHTSLSVEEALANAKVRGEGFFKVPKVIDAS